MAGLRRLTNSEIAAQQREIEARCRTKSGAPPIPPVLMSRSYAGGYSICYPVGHEELSEVRDSHGRTVFSGPRDDCKNWLRRRGIDA